MNIQYIVNLIKLRINNFGFAPLCNGKPTRGIYIGDFCLPFCARCTSMMLFTLIFYFLSLKGIIKRHSKITMALFILPLAIDGIAQYAFLIESTNFRRILTGAIFGFGYGNILAYMWPRKTKENENLD